jgi:hypothetical protein
MPAVTTPSTVNAISSQDQRRGFRSPGGERMAECCRGGVIANSASGFFDRKASQKYLKFSDQPIWLSLSVG